MRSGFTALHRLNRDGAIDPVNLGKRSRKRFLGQSRRADNGEGRSTSQNDLCDFHSSLPVFEICAISPDGPDWFLRRKTRRYAPAEGGFDDLQGEDTPKFGLPHRDIAGFAIHTRRAGRAARGHGARPYAIELPALRPMSSPAKAKRSSIPERR